MRHRRAYGRRRQDVFGPKRSASRRGQSVPPSRRQRWTLLHLRQCAADSAHCGAAERWPQQDRSVNRVRGKERAQSCALQLRTRPLGRARNAPSRMGLLTQNAPGRSRHSGRARYLADWQKAKSDPRHSKILSESVGTTTNRRQTAADRHQTKLRDKAYSPDSLRTVIHADPLSWRGRFQGRRPMSMRQNLRCLKSRAV